MPSRSSEIGGRRPRIQSAARRARRGALWVAAFLLAAAPVLAGDPLNAVRAFCQADGHGARLAPGTWPGVANLVAWELEPAWDHVNLIRGYEVGTPQQRTGTVTVEVKYTLSDVVRSTGVESAERVESRTYVLEPGATAGGWRLRAPPPPPYVFANQVDPQALAALLEPGKSDYVSNSAFVWQLLKGAGWELPHADVAALASAPYLTPARTAQIGDLVLYYAGDTPYHVGVVESDDQVVSATINAGIRRAPFAAFAGEVRYRRPQPPGAATPSPAATPAGTPATK